ncbi:MAG: prepilin-type N-terminal cleavage/methylation domain-containing protein, partial [bacterium]|nr:prepilin-type N-terminal cleavage/methylation domain-containing protein [bacterium]
MRRGFTLIEVLLYTALLGIILGTFVLTTTTVLESRAKSQTALMLNEGMRYAMERIAYRIANASAVTLPASGTGPALTLTMPTPSQNPTAFTLSGGVIMIAQGGGA